MKVIIPEGDFFMKLRMIILMMVIGVIITPSPAHGNGYDFREVNWGMSRRDVIRSEDQLPNWEDVKGRAREIGYRFTSFDDDPLVDYIKNEGIDWIITEIRYHLISEQLIAVELTAYPPIINDPKFEYERLYSVLSSWLSEQYGEGDYREIWESGPREGSKETNIYVGELSLQTEWDIERSSILLEQHAHTHLGTEVIRTRILLMAKQKTP